MVGASAGIQHLVELPPCTHAPQVILGHTSAGNGTRLHKVLEGSVVNAFSSQDHVGTCTERQRHRWRCIWKCKNKRVWQQEADFMHRDMLVAGRQNTLTPPESLIFWMRSRVMSSSRCRISSSSLGSVTSTCASMAAGWEGEADRGNHGGRPCQAAHVSNRRRQGCAHTCTPKCMRAFCRFMSRHAMRAFFTFFGMPCTNSQHMASRQVGNG